MTDERDPDCECPDDFYCPVHARVTLDRYQELFEFEEALRLLVATVPAIGGDCAYCGEDVNRRHAAGCPWETARRVYKERWKR